MTSKNPSELDFQLVDDLLRNLREGNYPALQKLEEELIALRMRYEEAIASHESTNNLHEQLRALLCSDPAAFGEAKAAIARYALSFVEGEVRHYARIRQERPLTDKEKQYGRGELMSILDMLDKWFPS